MDDLLKRSVELAAVLTDLLAIPPGSDSDRVRSTRILCEVSFEHAESVRILVPRAAPDAHQYSFARAA